MSARRAAAEARAETQADEMQQEVGSRRSKRLIREEEEEEEAQYAGRYWQGTEEVPVDFKEMENKFLLISSFKILILFYVNRGCKMHLSNGFIQCLQEPKR